MLNKELKQGGSVQDILQITIYFFQTHTLDSCSSVCIRFYGKELRMMRPVRRTGSLLVNKNLVLSYIKSYLCAVVRSAIVLVHTTSYFIQVIV